MQLRMLIQHADDRAQEASGERGWSRSTSRCRRWAVSTGGTINWLIKSAVRALHQSMWPRFSLIAQAEATS